MTTNGELELLLSKLSNIQKQLGGNTDVVRNKDTDEFNSVKLKLVETINEVSKKQDDRDNNFNKHGRNMAVIKLGIDIQDNFTDLDSQLQQMKDALRRQKKHPKKYPASDVEVKEQQYEKYASLVNQLKARENGDPVDEEKPITLTELKINLGAERRAPRVDVGRQLNDIELEAMEQFKKKDQEIDAMAEQVVAGLDVLKNKAEIMGEALENQEKDIAGLEKEVNAANEQLVTANARLKKVLYQYRKPQSFCMNVICLLIMLGLIGVIIKLSTTL